MQSKSFHFVVWAGLHIIIIYTTASLMDQYKVPIIIMYFVRYFSLMVRLRVQDRLC